MDSEDQLEFQEIDVLCVHCGRRHGKEVGWLKRHHELACDSCGRSSPLDRDLLVCAIEDMRKDLEELDQCLVTPATHQH